MLEKNFQTKFNKWLQYNWNVSARFELKFVDLTKKNKLYFKTGLPEHQIRALSAKKHIFKIPDAGYQNPYDCYCITGKGYLVIQFWEPRVKHFYMIDIQVILGLLSREEKGIDEIAARHFGTKYCL